MAKKRIYCDISKVEDNDDGTITVTGIASSGAVDSDGETITPEAMKNAIPDYMKFGAVREMHQPSAAGTAVSCSVDDVTGKTDFSALVVDEQAIKKVKTGVYKGFSIGGKVTERDPKDKKIIKGLNLIEISLVDRPANPEALMTMYKAASTPEDDVSELAELLDAGTVTPAQVLALVKSAQAVVPVVPPEGTIEKNNTTAEGDGSMGVPPKGGATPGTDPSPEAGQTGTITKGMYSISEFAYALNSISYLVADAAWEATYEADGSSIPAKLFAWLKTGTDILKEMTAEETAEMIEALRQAVGAPEVVEMAAKAGLPGTDLQKVGAQFSAKTKAALADAHKSVQDACDKMEALGYKTDDDTESAAQPDTTKAATSDTAGIDLTIQEAVAKALAPINTNLEKLGKENQELKDQLEKAQARFNAMPAPGKALLKAMTKGQDAAQVVKNDTPPEVLPPEGTTERAEYEMKKVFASRGLQ